MLRVDQRRVDAADVEQRVEEGEARRDGLVGVLLQRSIDLGPLRAVGGREPYQ